MGWVKNWRQIEDWEWYKIPNMAHLFQHLIRRANHEPQKWQGLTIERGQLATSYPSMASQTGLSIKEVRTCINNLKRTGELACKSTNRFTIITLSNYDSYQSEGQAKGKEEGRPAGSQGAGKGQAKGNKQECKEYKNDKEGENNTTVIKPLKLKYLEFVYLTEEEHQKLTTLLGQQGTADYIDRLNNYVGSKGVRYKSHYHTILNWHKKDGNSGSKPLSSGGGYVSGSKLEIGPDGKTPKERWLEEQEAKKICNQI